MDNETAEKCYCVDVNIKFKGTMSDPLANIPDVPSVDATKAKELVEEKSHALLDVRTVEEYERGHVAGSVNVPYLFFKQDGTKEVSTGLAECAELCLLEQLVPGPSTSFETCCSQHLLTRTLLHTLRKQQC